MLEVPLDKIRNIGLAAHIDAGKTTTTERILFYAGRVHRMGEVDEGSTVTDYLEEEKRRGITITSAVTFCNWQDCFINIIDTPGHVDFTVEVERSLRVLDGLIVVFSAVEGVQPQSETVWRQANKYNIPRLAYINKMDRIGANFFDAVEKIRSRLGSSAIPLQIPIGKENSFTGVVDLIEQNALIYTDDLGTHIMEEEIPQDLKEEAKFWRDKLLEKIAETNDLFLMKYLEGEEFTVQEIKEGVRSATIKSLLVPVLCGASFRNKGVQPLLDAVIDYLPSPLDVPGIKGIDPQTNKEELRNPQYQEPFSALVYKIVSDPYVGKLVFIRVYSGVTSSGAHLLNPRRMRKERVGRILRMHANHREEIKQIGAGDLAALVGMKDVTTGDTICEENQPIILESIQFPEPVISIAIEPKGAADEEKIANSLIKIQEEDPTFKIKIDQDTGQTIISGMGELHLEIITDRLLREFRVAANVGKPQVAYKETITKKAKGEAQFIRQTGGRGHYGHVVIEVAPNEKGKGFYFASRISADIIPREYWGAVEEGVRSCLESGVLAGYPLIDVKAYLVGGSFHEVDSSELAFKIAGGQAFRQALEKADPVLKEPIMSIEVVTLEDYLGDVISDLNSRRASIEGMEIKENNTRIIQAVAPLSEMFGYATDLRSKTQGRATYAMEFSYYEEVPKQITDKLILRGIPQTNINI